MRTLYLDCGMGAAGDMLAAALLELLPDTVIMPMVVAVGVVELMMVVIALFLFTVYRHGHVGSCNTTFHGRFLLKNNARNPKPIEFPHKFIRMILSTLSAGIFPCPGGCRMTLWQCTR